MKAVTRCPHAGRGAGAKYSVIRISYFPSSPLSELPAVGAGGGADRRAERGADADRAGAVGRRRGPHSAAPGAAPRAAALPEDGGHGGPWVASLRRCRGDRPPQGLSLECVRGDETAEAWPRRQL